MSTRKIQKKKDFFGTLFAMYSSVQVYSGPSLGGVDIHTSGLLRPLRRGYYTIFVYPQ